MRGDGRIFERGAWKWIAYSYNGKEYREPAKTRDGKNTDDAKEAEKFLQARLKQKHAAEISGTPFVTPAARRLTVHDLIEALRQDYSLRGKLSPQSSSHLDRVDRDFGEARAAGLTAERIDNYVAGRVEQGHAASSINRAMQLLGQSYKLAIRNGHLSHMPPIRHLSEEGNARQGFLDEPEFRALLSELPSDLKDFVRWGYLTGMRKGEIASLRWQYLADDVLWLEAKHSKNRKPRPIPLVGELAEIIERRKAARQIQANGTVELSPLIFHRGGEPIREFRKSWRTACRRAGVERRLFHDLRRSAVRNMVRAGVQTKVAMKVSGHATLSMFERYNIVVEDDVREALAKTEQYREAAQQKVVSIAQR
jgi:integrase